MRPLYLSLSVAEADIRLTTVSKDGATLSKLIPAGSLSKSEGENLIAGKWLVPGVAEPVDLSCDGGKVKSVQLMFGNPLFLGEVEGSEKLFGLHVTLGGFPMKAWLSKSDGKLVLLFSNGGRWSKVESKL